MRTFGSPTFALLLQQAPGGAAADGGSSPSVVALVASSSPVAKAVLVVLVIFSVISWAIVFYKLLALRKAEQQSASFLEVFRKSSKFSEVQAVCKSLSDSPLVGLFLAGYAELTTQLRHGAPAGQPGQPPAQAPRPALRSLPAIDRSLMRASVVEMAKLEHRVGFLATTASITPFIGLFGTVWGIIAAFQGIGQTGSTSLGVVAPGIAEALIATAAGLFAAIPAVYFYNALSQRVNAAAAEMDDFAMEFLNIVERNFS